jgi:hypothetical protein
MPRHRHAPFLSPSVAARIVGVSPTCVRNWIIDDISPSPAAMRGQRLRKIARHAA